MKIGPRYEYTYTVFFQPAQEGGWIASVPALPGCYTQGDTITQARAMAVEAIAGYLEALEKDGQTFPQDVRLRGKPTKERIRVALDPA